MRKIGRAERRSRLVRLHLLDGSADGPEAVVRALVALHATDPASVYLSVLARSRVSTLSGIADALYDRRTLVRWMAMRRTLFVFSRSEIPVVSAGVSDSLAKSLRRALLSRIARNGIEPPIEGDLSNWLDQVEDRVVIAVRQLGSAGGAELRTQVPELRSVIAARTRSEVPQALTSPLLTVLSTAGRLVRGPAVGTWTTRNQRWEHVDSWWPGGVPVVRPGDAQVDLARRWLERFGPATIEDLQWWTGWNKTVTRAAVDRLPIEDVELDGRPGIDLVHSECATAAPVSAALLPALDPTPMGWKHRDWFTATDPGLLYDRAGNIGPTLWWNGELVGAWSSTATGIRLGVTADRGREAVNALEVAAHVLEGRLGGAVVVPAVATPLERRLAAVE